jgi:glycerol-3-phosphate dehydrogenase
LGPHLGDELYGAEVRYLQEEEWARTADDILWRRTKLGLHLSEATQEALARHLGETGGAKTGDGARLKSARSQGVAAK